MATEKTPPTPADRFELPAFFEGATTACGVFEDRFGRVRRRFEVAVVGAWVGPEFVMDERLTFDDGTVEVRTWRLAAAVDGAFTATTSDGLGAAAGVAAPGRVEMRYGFRLAMGRRVLRVAIHDRFYRMDADIVINRATVRWWGVKIGEISAVFQRSRAGEVVHPQRTAARRATLA